MEAVATGNEVAGDVLADAVLDIGNTGMIGVEIVRRDVGGLIDRGQTGSGARVHQVERDFGLAVDHHRLAGGGRHIDAVARAAEGQLDAMMDQAFAVCARAGAHLVEQCDRSLFKQAGADAAEHIVRGLAFQNHVIDSIGVQQLPQQQSRRPRANDCYFCPQYLLPWLL